MAESFSAEDVADVDSECAHEALLLLSPHELIRKYRCRECGLVVMCDCDERLGRRYFNHQLRQARDSATGLRVRVTGGFMPRACNRCRGLPDVGAPRAEAHGRSSKIRRYYWRELHLTTIDRFGQWAGAEDFRAYHAARREHPEEYKRVESEVLEEIKLLHAKAPLYIYSDVSQAEVLKVTSTPVIDFDGTYVADAGKDRPLVIDGERFGPEEFAARHFDALGFQTLRLESTPFHAIFGGLMWMWVQSPSDPLQLPRGFGRSLKEGQPLEQIWTLFPEDFGSTAHATRCSESLNEHLAWLPSDLDQLLWTFDYWLEASRDFRAYLWAFTEDAERRARQVIEVLGGEWTIKVCRFLAEAYWDRYLGWPDLLVWNADEFFLAEVKSSHDRLSDAQRSWLLNNHEHLGLPARLVKIHKRGVVKFGTVDQSLLP